MTVSISSLGKYHDITKYRYIAEHCLCCDIDIVYDKTFEGENLRRFCGTLPSRECFTTNS